MTNEEAIQELKLMAAEVEWEYSMDYQVAIEKAIEALDPFDDRPCISFGVCSADKMQTLKKIRDEIKEAQEGYDALGMDDIYQGLAIALNIIEEKIDDIKKA